MTPKIIIEKIRSLLDSGVRFEILNNGDLIKIGDIQIINPKGFLEIRVCNYYPILSYSEKSMIYSFFTSKTQYGENIHKTNIESKQFHEALEYLNK